MLRAAPGCEGLQGHYDRQLPLVLSGPLAACLALQAALAAAARCVGALAAAPPRGLQAAPGQPSASGGAAADRFPLARALSPRHVSESTDRGALCLPACLGWPPPYRPAPYLLLPAGQDIDPGLGNRVRLALGQALAASPAALAALAAVVRAGPQQGPQPGCPWGASQAAAHALLHCARCCIPLADSCGARGGSGAGAVMLEALLTGAHLPQPACAVSSSLQRQLFWQAATPCLARADVLSCP